MLARRQDLRGLLTLLVINVLISFLPGVSLVGHFGGLIAGAATAGLILLTRRRRALQIVALVSFGILLLAVALTASTLVVINL